MKVVEARAGDVASWLTLAADVEPLFGPMPDFDQVLLENIERRCALVVHDEGGAVAGGLLLAGDEDNGRVTWLAVRPNSRRQGIGASLVREALRRLGNSSTVSVVSFGPDIVEGRAARLFYEHLGFQGRDMVADGPVGGSRQRFVRLSDSRDND